MHKNRSRGFTLIELLVVIAIIGILSAVVLASLNTARNKGNDAAVKSNLDTIRTQSAIYYDTNIGYSFKTGNSYPVFAALNATAAACTQPNSLFVDANIAAAITAADAASTQAPICSIGASTASAASASWAVYTPLTVGTVPAGWCVDSTGKSQASNILTGAVCP